MTTDILYNLPEKIRSDMRLLQIQNLRRCSMINKYLHHPASSSCRILDECIQLSIRKGSCSALAKLNIAVIVQLPGVPKFGHLLLTLCHLTATLQNDRFQSLSGKLQCRKNTCRSHADDHRA